jgi:phage portal protein BeeE
MTYWNAEQESIEFVRYSLAPWLRRIELAISARTLPSSCRFSRKPTANDIGRGR